MQAFGQDVVEICKAGLLSKYAYLLFYVLVQSARKTHAFKDYDVWTSIRQKFTRLLANLQFF